MAKNNFRVPASERDEFARLVRRANAKIYANMKYIQQEEITSDSAKRALLGHKATPEGWHTAKTPFSRSVKFGGFTDSNGRQISGENEYKAYKRMLERFAESGEHDPETLKQGYYESIIKSLNVVADNIGEGILTTRKKLPANLAKKIQDLTLEQMTHYFDEGDISEDFEYRGYRGEDYADVFDRKSFVDVTMQRINTLKELYPSKEQKALKATYGKKYPNKTITQLESMHKRATQRKLKKK